MIAVAESGDAALTADDLGELRLWPALDGSRPALPLPTEAPPVRMAIAGGEDLVVAFADNEADVTVMRLGRDGSVHAHAQVASEIGIEQLAFLGRDLLVRRVDQTIERYNDKGTLLGRVVAGAGERLGAIATRDRFAIVASADGDQLCRRLRWLTVDRSATPFGLIDRGLVWGAEIPVPNAIALEPLAISPDGRRVAAELRAIGPPAPARSAPPAALPQIVRPPLDTLAVFQLGLGARAIDTTPQVQLAGRAQLGFIDGTNLAIAQTQLTWWSATPPTRDPWDGEPAQVSVDASTSAIGNGVVVTAFASGLALRDPQHTHYLGWSHVATGSVQTAGTTLVVGPTDNSYEWFDENLAEAGGVELTALAGSDGAAPNDVVAIGDHQVAELRRGTDRSRVALVDAREPHDDVELDVELSNGQQKLVYEPSLQELDIIDNRKLYRFHVSLAPLTASPLPTFELPENVIPVSVHAVDPRRAGGAVALVVGYDNNDGYTLRSLYPDRAQPEKPHHVTTNPLAVDLTGTWYTHKVGTLNTIVGTRGDRVVVTLDDDEPLQQVVPNADSSAIVLVTPIGVELRDSSGKSRWKQQLWEPTGAWPSIDGRRIFVSTRGGLVALDGNDGSVVARTCGTQFGLHSTPLTTAAFEAPPVCED
jgi:hypothetical protein